MTDAQLIDQLAKNISELMRAVNQDMDNLIALANKVNGLEIRIAELEEKIGESI